MNRYTIAAGTLLAGTTVLAQNAPAPAPAVAGGGARAAEMGPDSYSRPDPFIRTGGSLLQAQLGVRADPQMLTVAKVSLTAVPPPEAKVVRRHDLIQIIVKENSVTSSDSSAESKKEANLDAKIEQMVKLQLSNAAIQGGAQGATPPEIKLGGSRDTKGSGKVDRTDNFEARIAAMIVDVKPNGTFMVQARKTIKADEELQEFVLTGMCRAADVLADNTILSTQVYDLRIEKATTGSVRDATKRGLLPRLLDFVNPF